MPAQQQQQHERQQQEQQQHQQQQPKQQQQQHASFTWLNAPNEAFVGGDLKHFNFSLFCAQLCGGCGQSVNHIFSMHNMQRTNQRAAARKANFHSILIGAKQAIDVEEMESERERESGRERERKQHASLFHHLCL